MSENNKVKVNIENQPRPYEKLYIIPESAFADPEFPTYLEAQVWMQDFDNIPVIERYHATVIYNTPSYETEFGNIVVNPEYAWRVITDGFGGTDIVTYKTKPQTAKVILFNAIVDDEGVPIISVIYNNTGRTVSYNAGDFSFRLTGPFTNNYITSYDQNDYVGFITTKKSNSSFVGFMTEEGLGASFTEGFGITIKIEIYE